MWCGLLFAQGREAASRTSRWTIAIAFVIPVILLLLGGVVGKVDTLANSLVPYEALPLGSAAALCTCGWRVWLPRPSNGARISRSREAGQSSTGGAVIAASFVLVFGLGLALVYGGAFVAPTLQAFLLAAAPALAIGYFRMFFGVFVLASAADTQLAASSELAAENTVLRRRRPITGLIVVVAVVLAILVPAPGRSSRSPRLSRPLRVVRFCQLRREDAGPRCPAGERSSALSGQSSLPSSWDLLQR